jgi:glutathione S-transferase
MKLFFSPASPYARKVLATAIAGGQDSQLTLVPTNPHDSGAELVAANPLSKIPCLITDDGVALFDSPVICEYLDAIAHGTLFPGGAARWRVLKNQAIGDGIMDAAVSGRGEAARPVEEARNQVIARCKKAVSRTLDMLEADVPPDHLDIGTLAIGCALGYLDFRFAADAWRTGRPKLSAWYAKMAERPELAKTQPPKA